MKIYMVSLLHRATIKKKKKKPQGKIQCRHLLRRAAIIKKKEINHSGRI